VTQIKICGLTDPEDVRLACALGASYVGFVFARGSPRQVRMDRAAELAAAVAPGVSRVGVFVDEDYEAISQAVAAAKLDLVQVHRPLRAEDLERIPVPVWAVARVADRAADVPPPELLGRCKAILFDTAGDRSGGGIGRPFDWSVSAGRDLPVPLFLAGGLAPDNVGDAIARVHPSGVDVSSGVEREPGVKDRAKLERFFQEVRQADARSG
jgi:phosphoribosylanthranilate isomerase